MRKELRGACPSCGFKRPTVVEVSGRKYAAKCIGCGLNTGPKKSYNRAVNAWNAIRDRVLQRFDP